jgi:hypothetical protein
MTVFSLGLSIVKNFILCPLTIFSLSSFRRPLLFLTLFVLICWLGEAQGWCSESSIVICMCGVGCQFGRLDRCAC